MQPWNVAFIGQLLLARQEVRKMHRKTQANAGFNVDKSSRLEASVQGGVYGGCRRERERARDIRDDWHDGGEGNTQNSLFFSWVCGWLIRRIRGESHECALY